jgi:hypothetical protein
MQKFSYSRELYCFRFWSRRKHAVIPSLSGIVKICVLSFCHFLISRMPLAQAQPDTDTLLMNSLEIKPVEVIGRRSPAVFSEISLSITHGVVKNLVFSWKISYQDRYGDAVGYNAEESSYYTIPYKPFWLLDGTITWNISFLRLFVEVSNILNTRYIDAGSFIQPGVWPKAGLALRL